MSLMISNLFCLSSTSNKSGINFNLVKLFSFIFNCFEWESIVDAPFFFLSFSNIWVELFRVFTGEKEFCLHSIIAAHLQVQFFKFDLITSLLVASSLSRL